MNEKLSQNFLKEIQFPELHLVLGGLSGQSDPNSFNPTADSLVARRIGATERALIADNNEWQYGKVYSAWGPDITTNYYAYNTSNRIVYICTDNKPNNRIDEESAISTIIPSHTTPTIETYDDGYSWIPYFKTDITQLEFLSKTDLPIPNLGKSQAFSSFSDKYESLCGTGLTSYGCCCLYFKENSVDEVTSEVYNAGDVTNEVIFSDCFECQKLADALDRDVIFLSGVTSGGITSSHPLENPLCPATKIIKTLQDELTEEQYTLVPGSSREYALYLLNNFTNETGIMAARIDLSGLTLPGYTSTITENPEITIKDQTGTGARIRVLTSGLDPTIGRYPVIGVELLESGTGYTEVTDWSLDNTFVDDYIQLVHFPSNFYNDPTQLVPGKRYRIKAQITSDELASNVNVEQITKFAVLSNPQFYGSEAPAIYPEGDRNFRPLQTNAFAITGPFTSIV